MTADPPTTRRSSESGFGSHDRTRLFYRIWEPTQVRATGAQRALVFLHRGHEHSGRIQTLVDQFDRPQEWAFAWDARGHGYSPGERGDAPDFETLVRDFECFVRHIEDRYGITQDNICIVANSVGAVIVATWLQDYGPRVRGVVMAAAAFDINLYVPLAKPALRLATCFKPDLFVTSYIRSNMLTHSREQAQAYDADALIAKKISARVLLSLADTAQRVVAEAASIDTPILMLVADKDYVVKQGPQRDYFERLSSQHKRYLVIPNCNHAIFYEDLPQAQQAIDAAKSFIAECLSSDVVPTTYYLDAHAKSAGAQRYQALQQGQTGSALGNAFFALQKWMLGTLGRLSNGMAIGLQHGFDSGASLDYVYRNQPGGRLLIGKGIDGGYLDAIGWRGIRLRKVHLQQALGALIERHPAAEPLRILDVAAGGGRYVLETAKRFQNMRLDITLRDVDQHNLDQAQQLAQGMHLAHQVDFQCRDAFSADSYPAAEPAFDIAIVSGLHELFNDNAAVLRSLQGIASQLKPGGYLVYTNQPWHPQLDMIAKTLNNHRGQAWHMRPRPQVEMDALVAQAGCRKVSSQVGLAGIFTVSGAQRDAAAPVEPG